MNIFITADRTHYRRWINILLSLLLPGSAQYLSGRKTAGILWFLANLLLELILTALILSNISSFPSWISFGDIPFTVVLIIDACRKPIPKMEKRKWFNFLKVYVLIAVIIPACLALLARQFLIQTFKVPTGAMQPTIMGITLDEEGKQLPGDQILVNKTAYWKQMPQRGDIIVFKTKGINHPNVKKSTVYIKRIVGLPGETVSINPPNLIVNGQTVNEPEIFKTITEEQNNYHGYVLANKNAADALLTDPDKSITLADDEYLVFGDNSKNSLDGRYYGPIKKSSILGKVVYRYFPLHRKGKID